MLHEVLEAYSYKNTIPCLSEILNLTGFLYLI